MFRDPIECLDVISCRFAAIRIIDICDIVEQHDRNLLAAFVQIIDHFIPFLLGQGVSSRVVARIIDDDDQLVLGLHDFLARLFQAGDVKMISIKQRV